MRPKKPLKTGPKLLQQQSIKIQQKLQDLRQQVKLKKKQQSNNRNSETVSVNGFLKSKPNITYPSDTRYQQAIRQLKLQSYEKNFKDKGINNYERLIRLTEEQIDQFKEIPVGYRIKLRKFIKQKSQAEKKQSKKQLIDSQNEPLIKKQSDRDIEAIIKSRDACKKFIPLKGQNQQQFYRGQQNIQQLNEEQQQSMIKSLMDAFSQRSGIIKNCPTSIHSSNKAPLTKKSELQKQIEVRHKQNQCFRYPKEVSPKLLDNLETVEDQDESKQCGIHSRVNQAKAKNQQKYCWNCFKKANLDDENRSYCSEKCKQAYLQNIINNEQFLYKHSRQYSVYEPQEKKQFTEDDVQIIDLSI